MTKADIFTQIQEVFYNAPNCKDPIPELMDLFIQLANEQCAEQKKICRAAYLNNTFYIDEAILNAPIPEIL